MASRKRPSLAGKSKPGGCRQRRRVKLIAQKRKRHRRQRSDFLLPAPDA